MKVEVILITEKWQYHPPEWVFLKEEKVPAELSNKRIYCRSRVFDRATGQEINSYHSTSYKHRVKI